MKYHSLYRLTTLCPGLTLLLLATIAFAAPTGNILGRVMLEDIKDYAIAASVKIIELDTVTKTDSDGYYLYRKVPNGVYTLRLQYVGYRPVKVDSVVVESGVTALQNMVLQPIGADSTEIKIKWSKPSPPPPPDNRILRSGTPRNKDTIRTIEPLKRF